jgi:lysophospholipase L1-like esterase
MLKNNKVKPLIINLSVFCASIFVAIVVFEFGFRLLIKISGKDMNNYVLRKDFDVSNYVPHPFLIYTLKPDLKKESLVTNSYGYRGKEFNPVKKEKGTFRIICIGASTTFGAYISGEENTYPRQLEKMLQKKFPGKIEVINAGICSYTSLENLFNFIINILPLDPDIVISHQGVNEVRPRSYPNFKNDYSHYRKTWSAPVLQPILYKIIKRTYSVGTYSWLYQFLIFKLTNYNKDIVYYTDRNEWLGIDCWPGKLDPKTTPTFERNMRTIAVLSKANNIKLLFATMPFKNNKEYQESLPKYVQGISEHNQIVRKITRKYRIPLAELDYKMTGDYDYFKDIVHVSEEGAKLKAEYVYEAILTNNLISD